MLIGIDGNEANIESRVGVNQYAYGLLCSIHKLQEGNDNNIRVIVYLKENALPDLPKETKNFKYKTLRGGKVWVITRLMSHLFLTREKPDVFFSPSHYLPPFLPMPMVCAIMDLGYLKFSGQFNKTAFWQLKYWTAISILVSKHIIAISKRTKEDIVRHYPFASRKITVTHLAYDKNKFNTKVSQRDVRRVQKKYSIIYDYVLFLSTLKPSKNVEGLLEAWKRVSSSFGNMKLVIAGKKGWLYESIFEKVKELGLSKNVVFTGFVDEKDKPALIKGARVFVLPSFWEGFGLDPLYAMASGVATVVSKEGSLPEVVGDAGVLVNPYEPESIAQGLEKVLSMDENEYNKIVEVGLKQAKKFSWEKTAQKTLEVLKEVSK